MNEGLPEESGFSGNPLPRLKRGGSSEIRIQPGRCWHRRRYQNTQTCLDVAPLARSKARGQQAIVDFPRHGVTIEGCCGQIEPRVGQAIGGAINVRLFEGHDTVSVLVDACYFLCVSIKEALWPQWDVRLKGFNPQENIKVQTGTSRELMLEAYTRIGSLWMSGH